MAKQFALRCIKNTNNRDSIELKASYFFGSIKKGEYVALTKDLKAERRHGMTVLDTTMWGEPMFVAVKDITEATGFRHREKFYFSGLVQNGLDNLMHVPIYNFDDPYSPDTYTLDEYFEIVEIP